MLHMMEVNYPNKNMDFDEYLKSGLFSTRKPKDYSIMVNPMAKGEQRSFQRNIKKIHTNACRQLKFSANLKTADH